MRVDAYFQSIHTTIDGCLWVRTSTLHFDQRATHQGFLRGEIRFLDGSGLHVREFVDTESAIERLAYSDQYMNRDRRLVFRHDNTGHHYRLKLSTYPHHKHEGSEEKVLPSSAPTLAQVLAEIEAQIRFPPN